jgi:hypothetical protein
MILWINFSIKGTKSMAIHNNLQLFVLDDLNITSVRCCTIIPTLNVVAEDWSDANFVEQQLV